MTSRLVDRLAVAATIVVFCAAIGVLLHEFASIDARDVVTDLVALPRYQILTAAGLTTVSYLLLTGYDFLALRYVRFQLRFRDILLASFVAFAFSNNIGLQLLSGGSIRYRIYSSLGLEALKIGEIVVFCTFTYALGAVTVGGLVLLFDPAEVAAAANIPQSALVLCGIVLLTFSIVYIALAAVWQKPVMVGRYRLRPPSLSLAFAQVALASIDAMLAGLVLYVLLPADLRVTYQSFLGVYLIAATLSVLSLVPGGLGVFEAVVSTMIASTSKAAMLGAFLVYRMIYFVVPLLIAIVCFSLHEFRHQIDK